MSAAPTPRSNGRARGPRVPIVTTLPTPDPEPTPVAPARAPTPNLDAAVLRVQAQAAPLVRNAPGQIQNRTYTYVTLSAVVAEVLPLLVAEELVWKTFPTALESGAPGLRYRITHIPSGESDEDTMPLPCDATMQGLGSGVTYGRRYALTAYLNLTIDEDDDGASANVPARTSPPASEPASTTPQPTAAAPKAAGRPATAKQRDMLRKKAAAAKLTEGQLANVVLEAAGDPPRVWRGEDHASQTLSRLLDRLPGKLVDAVIAGIAHAGAEGSQA